MEKFNTEADGTKLEMRNAQGEAKADEGVNVKKEAKKK
jgi:hypothetical protein